MFLLNDEMIRKYMDNHLLGIEDFDRGLLLPTHYYFRIGKWVRKWDKKDKNHHPVEIGRPGKEVFEIPPKGYASIISLERFYCSDKVLAIFGQISDLALDGLRLNHSPTIDPNFAGFLEMGIENLLDWPVELAYGTPIGKILFFDISDTYPIHDIANSISASKYERRGARRPDE